MPIQSAINRLIGTAGAAATLASKLGNKTDASTPNTKESGVDAKMALKARRVVQQKINAIYANKALSGKAMTRRVGQAIDEYSNIIGGNK